MEATTKPAALKMTFKEKSEWEQLNKEMPIMELKKTELVEQMNQPNLDYDAITKLSEALSAITNQLEAAELRWLELSEKQ